jgi:argininosuccinate synthase
MGQRIVLAYDGKADLAPAVASLLEEHAADVVTLTLDIGDGTPVDGIRDVLLARGAARAHVLEVQEAFAREIILPAARAGSFHERSLTSLARPLTARKLVEIARIERASAIAYVTDEHDDGELRRLLEGLDPSIEVIPLKGAAVDVRRSPVKRTSLPAAADVGLSFANGIPTAINGIAMRLPELIDSLATISAEHGIGTSAHVFMPALAVLQCSFVALGASRDGVVHLKLSNGTCQVTSFEHLHPEAAE